MLAIFLYKDWIKKGEGKIYLIKFFICHSRLCVCVYIHVYALFCTPTFDKLVIVTFFLLERSGIITFVFPLFLFILYIVINIRLILCFKYIATYHFSHQLIYEKISLALSFSFFLFLTCKLLKSK